MHYELRGDAEQYLTGSYVRDSKGRLVYINSIEGDDGELLAVTTDTETGTHSRLLVDSLNLIPPKLGYVMSGHYGCCYVQRNPSRSFRQGISNDNTKALANSNFRFGHLSKQEMVNLINGIYPTVFEAREQAIEESTEVAFSRVFSIDRDCTVRYRTRVVGSWEVESFTLLPKFKYLYEMLKEYEECL